MKKDTRQQPPSSGNPKTKTDLSDSPEDQARMQQEETTLNLPEVKDIPGQEHVRPPKMKEMADTTPSSADEEADAIFEEETGPDASGDANVSAEEITLLEDAGIEDPDDIQLRRGRLDSTDEDGDPLNEEGFGEDVSGDDLDVPGSEEDDADEEIGEEDEENNPYSVDEENED